MFYMLVPLSAARHIKTAFITFPNPAESKFRYRRQTFSVSNCSVSNCKCSLSCLRSRMAMEKKREFLQRKTLLLLLCIFFTSSIVVLSGTLLYHNIPKLAERFTHESLPNSAAANSNGTKPNIIFILLDDMGWNDLSFHGYDELRSTNIDWLAKEGVILNGFYGQYLCTPSRTALMTGKYPIKYGLQAGVLWLGEARGLDRTAKLLPQYLKELGYDTHAVGKWHLGYFQKKYLPTNRGFDTFFGFQGAAGIDHYNHTAANKYDTYDLWDNHRPAMEYRGQHITSVFADVAIKRIESHDVSKPMFLYFCHNELYNDEIGKSAPVVQKYYDRFPDIKLEGRRKHAATVAMIDDSVGSVMDALKRKDMLKNTVVVVMSDNGGAGEEYDERTAYKFYSSNWPLRGTKGSQWEGGVRVGTLVWSPLLTKPGTVSTELYHMTDWLPTFVRLAGGKPEDITDLDGFDIWDSISRSRPSPRTELLITADSNRGRYAYRWKQYKLMYYENSRKIYDQWAEPSGGLQGSLMRDTPGALRCGDVEKVPCDPLVEPCLFDVVIDPCEYRNLANQFPAIVHMIMDKVRTFNESYPRTATWPLDPRSLPSLHDNMIKPWDD